MELDQSKAEMIAVRSWSNGDRGKMMMWGVMHEDYRTEHIRFVHAVAQELIALGWTPPLTSPPISDGTGTSDGE